MITKIISVALLAAQAVSGAAVRRHDEDVCNSTAAANTNANETVVVTFTTTVTVPPNPSTTNVAGQSSDSVVLVTVTEYTTVQPTVILTTNVAGSSSDSVVLVTVTEYTTVQPTPLPSGPSSGGYLSYALSSVLYSNTSTVVGLPSNTGFVGAPSASSGSSLVYNITSLAPYLNSSALGATSTDRIPIITLPLVRSSNVPISTSLQLPPNPVASSAVSITPSSTHVPSPTDPAVPSFTPSQIPSASSVSQGTQNNTTTMGGFVYPTASFALSESTQLSSLYSSSKQPPASSQQPASVITSSSGFLESTTQPASMTNAPTPQSSTAVVVVPVPPPSSPALVVTPVDPPSTRPLNPRFTNEVQTQTVAFPVVQPGVQARAESIVLEAIPNISLPQKATGGNTLTLRIATTRDIVAPSRPPLQSISESSTKSSAKSSSTFEPVTSTKSAPPASKTIVVSDGAHCPYPYPGEHCGKPSTTLATETKKESASTTDKERPKSTGWCPYPGQIC